MKKKLWGFLALMALMVGTAAAQDPDARRVLQAAARTMGATDLESIQYSGTGWAGIVGQSYSPDTDWPRVDIASYARTIDYDSSSSKEELVRVQGRNRARGGGGLPIVGEQRLVQLVSGDFAWDMQGSTVTPTPAATDVRKLEIWLTPHGFLKAALQASNPLVVSRIEEGKSVTVISIVMGKYKVNGMISAENVVERVETWIPNPVLGDMLYELRYTNYKDFAGVRFPTRIHTHQGDTYKDNASHSYGEIRVTGVTANVASAALTVPDVARRAALPAVQVQSQKLADGVWLLGGGTHNSVLVEFKDFVSVVEAPLNEERSLAVISEVKRLVPNKPIQYVVNTHHHFDHSGGLRTYAALGARIITHRGNREFYRELVVNAVPRTLVPDRLSLQPRIRGMEPIIETAVERYALSDGTRTLEMYQVLGIIPTGLVRVEGFTHSANMLIAYLPNEKILIEADLYTPPPQGSRPPATPSGDAVTLFDNIKWLNLDVAQIAPLHGRAVPMEDFVRFIGSAANPN